MCLWQLTKHLTPRLTFIEQIMYRIYIYSKTSGLCLLSDSENMRFCYQWNGLRTIMVCALWLLGVVSNVTSTKYQLMASITNQTAPLTCSASHSRSRLETSVACEGDQDCRAIWSHRTEGGQLQHGVCHCMRDPAVRSQIAPLDPGLHVGIAPKFSKGLFNVCILCFNQSLCLNNILDINNG